MNLQKTQVFQRKRWNPCQSNASNATTLPNIRHKSQARQLQSPATSLSGLTVFQPMNNGFDYRVTNDSRATNFHYSRSQVTNNRAPIHNIISNLPISESIVNPTINRQPSTYTRQIMTPITSLTNISQSRFTHTRDNPAIKFNVAVDQTLSGEIKGYTIQQEPEQLMQLRAKQRMLEVYLLEMKEKVIVYKKEIFQLEEEKWKLTRKKEAICKGCNPKDVRRVQQIQQKLRKKQQEIKDASINKEFYIHATWGLRDQFFQLHQLYQEALQKLPKTIRTQVESKQFCNHEARLIQMTRMLEIKRETLETLQNDVIRLEKEKKQLNKQRTQVLLKLTSKR